MRYKAVEQPLATALTSRGTRGVSMCSVQYCGHDATTIGAPLLLLLLLLLLVLCSALLLLLLPTLMPFSSLMLFLLLLLLLLLLLPPTVPSVETGTCLLQHAHDVNTCQTPQEVYVKAWYSHTATRIVTTSCKQDSKQQQQLCNKHANTIIK
jgi:hypothetical protein